MIQIAEQFWHFQIQDTHAEEMLNDVAAQDDVLQHTGFTNELVNMTNKHRACQCLIVHLVLKTRMEEWQQLRDGLESISLLQFLQLCHGCTKFVFPSTEDMILKASDFLRLLNQNQCPGDSDDMVQRLHH